MTSDVAIRASDPRAERWIGEPQTVGTVAVVGLGKIGLPVAAQYARAGWSVIGVDVLPEVVDSVRHGRAHFDEEPGLGELVSEVWAKECLSATTNHADAAERADVIVMIVPLLVTDAGQPDYRSIDAATRSIAGGLRPGTLVIYETTVPVGDTRSRFGPLLSQESGLAVGDGDRGFLLAVSPERVSSGQIFRDLATQPKLVGGVDPVSAARAVAFYQSVLSAEVWPLPSAETAELAKLAASAYRDVNIALATEFARYSERVGVDILDVITAANSQPNSHLHVPGIGVGGHCIPVYPYFLSSRSPDFDLVVASRRTNDDEVVRTVDRIRQSIGGLAGEKVLVLGLTYRHGVREVAYSRSIPLIRDLSRRGAQVSAYDPLLDSEVVAQLGATPFTWGTTSDAAVLVTQTADPAWGSIDFACFPQLQLLFDGRNSLRDLARPNGVDYLSVGLGGPR